jgi:hypothetical protein
MNPSTTSLPLYVATNLSVYQPVGTASPYQDLPADLTLAGIPYRRLDPAYYSWLRSRMGKASRAHKDGRLDVHAFDSLRAKFNEIHDRAVTLFGEDALVSAVRSLDPRTYVAPTRSSGESPHIPGKGSATCPADENERPTQIPSPGNRKTPEVDVEYRYPEKEDPELRFFTHVRCSSVQKVRAIEGQALTAGWSPAELYQNRGRFRFPYGQDYGAVCFIGEDQSFGAVTERSLEVVYPDGHALYIRRRYREHVAATKSNVHSEEKTTA